MNNWYIIVHQVGVVRNVEEVERVGARARDASIKYEIQNSKSIFCFLVLKNSSRLCGLENRLHQNLNHHNNIIINLQKSTSTWSKTSTANIHQASQKNTSTSSAKLEKRTAKIERPRLWAHSWSSGPNSSSVVRGLLRWPKSPLSEYSVVQDEVFMRM